MPRYPFGDMGPVEIVWAYGESDEKTLSPFLGTVALRLEDSIQNIEEEGFGGTAVDAVITGSEAELEAPMTRNTLAQLAVITHGEIDEFGNLHVPAFVGCSMRDLARPIVIKPVCNNVVDADVDHWIKIHEAYPYRSFSLEFSRDAQRTHLAKFKVFVSLDSATYGEFWQYGVATS